MFSSFSCNSKKQSIYPSYSNASEIQYSTTLLPAISSFDTKLESKSFSSQFEGIDKKIEQEVEILATPASSLVSLVVQNRPLSLEQQQSDKCLNEYKTSTPCEKKSFADQFEAANSCKAIKQEEAILATHDLTLKPISVDTTLTKIKNAETADKTDTNKNRSELICFVDSNDSKINSTQSNNINDVINNRQQNLIEPPVLSSTIAVNNNNTSATTNADPIDSYVIDESTPDICLSYAQTNLKTINLTASDEKYHVYVSHVISPLLFWVQLKENQTALDNLNKKLK